MKVATIKYYVHSHLWQEENKQLRHSESASLTAQPSERTRTHTQTHIHNNNEKTNLTEGSCMWKNGVNLIQMLFVFVQIKIDYLHNMDMIQFHVYKV